MPQTLHKFGIDPSDPANRAISPTPLVTNTEIKVLWSSWCDLIYTTLAQDHTRLIEYLGTSLNASQQLDFPVDTSTPDSNVTKQGLLKSRETLYFFGTAMHDGVRGYVANGIVTVYGTAAERAALGERYRDVDKWTLPNPLDRSLAQVNIRSDGSVLLASLPRAADCEYAESTTAIAVGQENLGFWNTQAPEAGPQMISSIANLQELREHCVGTMSIKRVATFAPTQLVANATTATALDQNGQVHTCTVDPRYLACLGRPYTGTSAFEPVPYLSETRITKIASGGYMTAAISEDGELFLWGQVNPGTGNNLGVLHRVDYETASTKEKRSFIWAESAQDEDVKCLNIQVDGGTALAYAVAIGFGHLLVAAESKLGDYVVFAAGCGDEGQLGLGRRCDFLPEFEEVVELRGKRVRQLVATGWSSFVVHEE